MLTRLAEIAKSVVLAVVLIGGASALAAEAQPHFSPAELEARGATEMTEGRLVQETVVTCMPMQGIGPGCSLADIRADIRYGSFRRLRLENVEFVCVSFPAWTCYESK